jgi:hypothetical protein
MSSNPQPAMRVLEDREVDLVGGGESSSWSFGSRVLILAGLINPITTATTLAGMIAYDLATDK